jgi:hypothetical protein
MRRYSIILIIFLITVFQLNAKPAGIGVSIETGVEDILEVDEEYIFYVQPEITYALGATGFNFGLGWSVPVAPEAETGEVELWEEYIHTFPGIGFAIGNKNVYAIEDSELEGNIYITTEHSAGVFSFENEIEFLYAPDIEILTIPGIFHEIEFKRGTIETGVSQNILLFDEIALEETEFTLILELIIPRGFISFEIEPVLTEEQDFTMNAVVKIEQFY